MAITRMSPRQAITGESTEQLASVRWQSAFDALRKTERKTDEQIERLVGTLQKHPICGALDDAVLREVAHALRAQRVRAGGLPMEHT